MKFNWGTGIFLFYAFFAAMLVFQVVKSTKYDHSLVVEEYYKEDLAYQQKYDKKQNSLSLETPMRIEYDQENERVILIFPFGEEKVEGMVKFYRPSTRHLDMEFPVQTNQEGIMIVPVGQFVGGVWNVEADWSCKGVEYFDALRINLKGDQSLAEHTAPGTAGS